MALHLGKVNNEEAKKISEWIYEKPYEIYNIEGKQSCIDEFVNDLYFSFLDEDDEILGYFCLGKAAQVPEGNKLGIYDEECVDIGLGLRPDMCGKGLGSRFLIEAIEFATNQLSAKKFRLTVASFNKRAIGMYKKIGFKKINSFKNVEGNIEIDFDVMILE